MGQGPWGGRHPGVSVMLEAASIPRVTGTPGWAGTLGVRGRCPKVAGTPRGAQTLGARGRCPKAAGTPSGRDPGAAETHGWQQEPHGTGTSGCEGSRAVPSQQAQGTTRPPHLEGHLDPVVHPLLQHKGPAPQHLQVSCMGRWPISSAPLPPPPPPPMGAPTAHLSGPW